MAAADADVCGDGFRLTEEVSDGGGSRGRLMAATELTELFGLTSDAGDGADGSGDTVTTLSVSAEVH